MAVLLKRGRHDLSRTAGLLALLAFIFGGELPGAAAPRGGAASAVDLAAELSSLREEGRHEAALALLDEAVYGDLAAAADSEAAQTARPEWSLAKLQESLSSNTGLLVLRPAGDVVCAALVLRGVVQIEILTAPATQARAERLHDWLAAPASRSFDARAAWELQQTLVAPFRRGLQGLKRLVIVPSGCLRGLPFECLLLTEPQEPPAGSPTYLVRRYEVSYEPTLGSRLAWGSYPEGELLWRRGADPPAPAARALAECGHGARGVLVFRDGADLERWQERHAAERDGGRRSDATALRRVKLALIRGGANAPPEQWATWLLYGSP
jgi:hypothetical protein